MPQFQTISHSNLGGVQTSKSLDLFDHDDSLVSIGGTFDNRGAFEKRRGGSKYNTTSMGVGGLAIFDFRFDNDTSQKLLLYAADGSLKEGNAGSPANITTGLSTNRPDIKKFNIGGKDFAFIANTATMLKYDGTTLTNASIAAPPTAALAAAAAGGTLPNGTYIISYTFENADGEESNPSAEVSITLGGANGTIDLSSVDVSADSQVTLRRIYVTLTNGAILFANTTIPNNSATTISITAPSTGLELEYDHDVAPAIQYLEPFGNSMAGAGDANQPDVLFLSKIFDVWYWPQGVGSASDFRIKIGNGDPIRGIKSFFDGILVSTEAEVFLVTGIAEAGTIQVTKVRSDSRSGTVSHWSMEVIEGWCWYVGRNSVYRTNGYEIQDVGSNLYGYFDANSEQTRFKINKNLLGNCVAKSVKAKPHNWYLFSAATDTDTDHNTTFMMDFSSMRVDQATGRIKVDCSPWPGFYAQALGIVIVSGEEKLYRWDNYGFVFVEDSQQGDGSTITSTATAGGATTLTDSVQAWTVNAFTGLFVDIIGGTGEGQRRRISSNTATILTVSSAWTTNPDETSKYAIGGIEWDFAHFWDNYGVPTKSKRWRYWRPRIEVDGSDPIDIYFLYDFGFDDPFTDQITFSGQSLFDVALFDVAFFDVGAITDNLYSLPGDSIHRWSTIRLRNRASGNSIRFSGFDKIFQTKGMRPQ